MSYNDSSHTHKTGDPSDLQTEPSTYSSACSVDGGESRHVIATEEATSALSSYHHSPNPHSRTQQPPQEEAGGKASSDAAAAEPASSSTSSALSDRAVGKPCRLSNELVLMPGPEAAAEQVQRPLSPSQPAAQDSQPVVSPGAAASSHHGADSTASDAASETASNIGADAADDIDAGLAPAAACSSSSSPRHGPPGNRAGQLGGEPSAAAAAAAAAVAAGVTAAASDASAASTPSASGALGSHGAQAGAAAAVTAADAAASTAAAAEATDRGPGAAHALGDAAGGPDAPAAQQPSAPAPPPLLVARGVGGDKPAGDYGGEDTPGSGGSATGDAAYAQLRQISRRSSCSTPDKEARAASPLLSHHRHYFVLTSAGKPVFSYRGDEDELAGFMAVIQALSSVVADQGDAVRSLSAGPGHVLVLLQRGHLLLVGSSTRAEPAAALRAHLELLYGHVLLLVTSGVERVLQRSPGFDVRQLLAGTSPQLAGLLREAGRSPCLVMGTLEPAAAAVADRALAAEGLGEAMRESDAMYGLLCCGRRLLAYDAGRVASLHTSDLQLLLNLVECSQALRQGESFTPLCLPHFKASVFLHAYIACLDPAVPSFLVMLSGSDAFHRLSAARQLLEARLREAGVLQRLAAVAATPGSDRLPLEVLPAAAGGGAPGTTPLWHVCATFPQRKQLVMTAPTGLLASSKLYKEGVRAYVRMYCTVHAQALEAAQAVAGAGGAGGTGSGAGAGSGAGGSSGGGGLVSSGLAALAGGSAAGSAVAAAVGVAGGGGSAAAAAAAAAAAYVLPLGPPRPHRALWVAGQQWIAAALVEREVEVYALLDPLTDHDLGWQLLEGLRRHFGDKARQQELLLPGL